MFPARLPHAPPPLHHPGRTLQPWQRRGIYAVVALLACTGLPWLALHYTVGAGAGELPHPLEAWLMRLHGLGAFAALFMLGVTAGVHVPRGWRMSGRSAPGRLRHDHRSAPHEGARASLRTRRAHQRALGLLVSGCAALLVLSAYAMYYLLPETWRAPVGWAHAALGLLLVVVLALHVRARHRRQARNGVVG